MLIEEFHPDPFILPEELDKKLADGWFRSGNMMYISSVTFFEGQMLLVVRTRIPLANYTYKKRLRKLIRRVESRFRVEVGAFEPTSEKQEMFEKHIERFTGHVPTSLTTYLLEDAKISVFDTREIRVFDGDQLIAVSFFDVGKVAMASILGIFDAAYERYSLGIYTMLAEVKFGIKSGYEYYYPGYILLGNSRFDYKLKLGHLEYFRWGEQWLPYELFDKDPYFLMLSKMLDLD